MYGLDISSFDISKRYSEIRTLYFSLKRRFSKSITNWPRLPPKIPFGKLTQTYLYELFSKAMQIGRFNLSVIASRMKAFGDLFEFVGTHQELLCSDEFVSFIQPPMKVTSTFVVDNATVPLRRSSTSAAQGGKLTYERERS